MALPHFFPFDVKKPSPVRFQNRIHSRLDQGARLLEDMTKARDAFMDTISSDALVRDGIHPKRAKEMLDIYLPLVRGLVGLQASSEPTIAPPSYQAVPEEEAFDTEELGILRRQLTGMGFDPEQVNDALEECKPELQDCMDYLLSPEKIKKTPKDKKTPKPAPLPPPSSAFKESSIPLETANTFLWTNLFGSSPSTSVAHVHHEIPSTLFGLALYMLAWAGHVAGKRAGEVSEGTGAGVDGLRSDVYKVLLQAAGVVEVVLKMDIHYGEMPVDLNVNVLQSMRSLALAQAQELSMTKGEAQRISCKVASKLFAGCAQLYEQSRDSLESIGLQEDRTGCGSLVVEYTRVKQLVMQSKAWRSLSTYYAAIASDKSDSDSMGLSVRCAKEAVECAKKCERPLQLYIRSSAKKMVRMGKRAIELKNEVQESTDNARRDLHKREKENSMVHSALVPEDPPRLPVILMVKPQAIEFPQKIASAWTEDVLKSMGYGFQL